MTNGVFMMRTWRLHVFALVSAMGLFACGSEGTDQTNPDPAPPRDFIKEWYGDPTVGCLPAGCAVTPVSVAAGIGHTCVRMADGSVRCWGDDSSQQLGGSSRDKAVPGLAEVVRVSAGRTQTCTISRGGTARCFGAINTRATGAEVTTDPLAVQSPMPRPVEVLNNTPAGYLSVLGGLNCSIMATDEASVMCWGEEKTYGLAGVLATFTGIDLKTLNRRFVDLTMSFWAMGLTRLDGTASICHGGNASTCVIPLGGRKDIGHVATAGFGGAFVVSRDGAVRAAGFAIPNGACGPDILPAPNGTCYGGCDLPAPSHCIAGEELADHWYPLQPQVIAGLEHVKQLEVNQLPGGVPGLRIFACAIQNDDSVACWGDNSFGQLATGAPVSEIVLRLQPIAVSHVTQISLGLKHACALTAAHEVYCWGDNSTGQLGDDRTAGQPPTTPVHFTP